MMKGMVIIMKRRNVILMVVLLITFALLTSACASKMSKDLSDSRNTSPENLSYGSTGNAEYDMDTTEPAAGETQNDGLEDKVAGFTDEDFQDKADISTIQAQDKIIRTFFLDVETQEFDSLITRIDSEISRLGGYVESSKVSGKRYNDDGARNGNIVARVPSDKVGEFVNIIGENANVVDSQESSKNVSLDYIDAESRIKALEIEQERLYAILEKEINLENIITLESRLSDIRYELQNYESKLRYYDNQVAYSTVTMNVQEVEKLTPVVEIKQSVGARIKNGFSDTIYHISEGFKNFFVWFVVNLPYLLIWAVIIAVAVLLIRRYLRKGKLNRPNQPDRTKQNNNKDNK
jgi:uncharacterized membrane protein